MTTDAELETRDRAGPFLLGMTLMVERAPEPTQVTELTNIFVQITAALTRVEDNPKVQAHRARGTVPPWGRWAASALALGIMLLGMSKLALEVMAFWAPQGDRLAQLNAPTLTSTAEPSQTALAYPPPYEPFRNQAKAPCRVTLGVAIQAEDKGKCYLPVSKERDRPAQAAEP